MRKLFALRGWGADGRTLGLGLALAMDKQRRDAARDVETYLRRTASSDSADRRVSTTSV